MIYGCTNFSNLCDIEKLQRKIFRLIFFKRFKDSISPILLKHGVLTVHELYVYELLKFLLRSVLSLHSESYLNYIFTFKNQDAYLTRRSSTGVMAMPAAKNKFQRVSLKNRGTNLFNILRQNNAVPQLCMMNKDIFNNLVHRIEDNYITGITELRTFLSNYKIKRSLYSCCFVIYNYIYNYILIIQGNYDILRNVFFR